MAGGQKVPVTEKALYQRINRKLAADGEKLKRARGANVETALGEYFVVDIYRNAVMHTHIDLEDYGRELDVLAEWEALQ